MCRSARRSCCDRVPTGGAQKTFARRRPARVSVDRGLWNACVQRSSASVKTLVAVFPRAASGDNAPAHVITVHHHRQHHH